MVRQVKARMMRPFRGRGSQQMLTIEYALQYLKEVKDEFKGNEKYLEFLEVMKEFKVGKLDRDGVVMRVKQLFKGHRYLILGFNAFLSPGFEISLPEEVIEVAVDFTKAINYVNKVKERFCANEHLYFHFLEILNMYRKGNKDIHEVYWEVTLLFANHNDLLQDFANFLPDKLNDLHD